MSSHSLFLRSLQIATLALCALGATTSAHAADVAVFPLETTNVSEGDASAIGELLAQAYAGHSRRTVLSPARSRDALTQAGGDYRAAAARLGVSEYLRSSAVGLGAAYVLYVQRSAADGTVLHSAKLTAANLEDAPNVVDRLASALWTQTSPRETRTPRNVTKQETRAINRAYTEKLTGIRVGLHAPVAKGVSEIMSLSIGFNMRLEQERYFLEFGAGGLFPAKSPDSYDYDSEQREAAKLGLGGFYTELGASYLLTRGNVAPYVGGGLRPGFNFLSDDSIVMLAPFAQVGLTLPRDSSTRFYVDLRVAQHVLSVSTEDREYWDGDRESTIKGGDFYPTEFILHAGIGW